MQKWFNTAGLCRGSRSKWTRNNAKPEIFTQYTLQAKHPFTKNDKIFAIKDTTNF
jgi:hypothetical protein